MFRFRDATGHTKRLFQITIIGSLVLFLVCLSYLYRSSFTDSILPNIAIHSVFESISAITSICLGIILLQMKPKKNLYFFPALGFLAMGNFEIIHAIAPFGQSSVFMHIMAVLSGGFGFALVWLSEIEIKTAYKKILIVAFVTSSLTFGLVSLFIPEFGPQMVHNGQFTTNALTLSIISGFLFLIGSAYLALQYYKKGNLDSFLLLSFSLMLGIADFVFEFSAIWDYQWWLWHVIRLGAFLLALLMIIRAYHRIQNSVALSNTKLAEQKELLTQMNQQLINKNKELDEFTYISSHDLKEPLRQIISFSGFLKRDISEAPEKVKDDLDFIISGATRMQTLIKDLLNFSRVGRKAMKKEKIQLDKCADHAIFSLGTLIREKNAKIIRQPLKETVGDKTLLIQLYQNLINNAIKFVPPDRKPIIHLTMEETEEKLILGVNDNGIGIEEQYFEQIFKPFKRLHSRDEYSGSGIGLAICSKALELHNGNLWVESEFGKGSHFRFELRKTAF